MAESMKLGILEKNRWQTVNEVSGKKSTSRAKLKATNKEKDFRSGKNIDKITDKPIKKL